MLPSGPPPPVGGDGAFSFSILASKGFSSRAMADTVEQVGASQRVLIVDDDPGTTETYARMLQLEGYTVHTALSAREALDHVERHRPDAVLVDLRMPEIDGLALLRTLRTLPPPVIPAAIITGDYWVDEDTLARIRDLGVPTILKPLWFEDLVPLVRLLLQQHQ